MEKTVTLRFYDVARTSADKPALADVLNMIAAKPMADREAHITDEGILVRLEDYAVEGDDGSEICGQFVRGQSGNLPGRMMPNRTDALPFPEPLGHGIAFRYRTTDGLLAIQYDSKILSPSRIVSYLEAHDPRVEYTLAPRMRADARQRFDDLPVRRIEVAVAGAANINDLERPDDAVWSNVARLKRHYGADTVRFQLSMGHRGGSLFANAKDIAWEAIQRFQNRTDDIRAIKALLDTGEGVPNEEIDLMGEVFDVKADLAFDGRDVQRFYQLRYALLLSRIQLL